MAQTLQGQGVPIPDRLTGPQSSSQGSVNGPQSRTATPAKTSRGSAPRRSTSSNAKSVSNRKSGSSRRSGSVASTIPDSIPGGEQDSGEGVGLLEAEFLVALAILVLLMFSDFTSTMTDKMMHVMKRGTLICAVFFILAIISGVGPRAAKVSKAFGALVIVAIIVTSDMGAVVKDLDNIIKNDWIGAPDDSTSNTGTSKNQPKATPVSDSLGLLEKVTHLIGQPGGPTFGLVQKGFAAIGIHI